MLRIAALLFSQKKQLGRRRGRRGRRGWRMVEEEEISVLRGVQVKEDIQRIGAVGFNWLLKSNICSFFSLSLLADSSP